MVDIPNARAAIYIPTGTPGFNVLPLDEALVTREPGVQVSAGQLLKLLLVAGGGALGSAARYLIGNWVQALSGSGFPWGTFFVNVSGSFLIGVVLGLFEISGLSNGARLFLAVGFLGGYTTFSTFGHETLKLLSNGAFGLAFLNAAGQLAAGLVSVFAGILLACAFGG